MSSDETNYFRKRALAERAMAVSAERIEVRAIHAELARLYEALVEIPELRPTPSIAC